MRKPPSQSCDRCVRRVEFGRRAAEDETIADTLIDVGDTEVLRHPPEHREHRIEPVLEAEMCGVLGFAGVQRNARRERNGQNTVEPARSDRMYPARGSLFR